LRTYAQSASSDGRFETLQTYVYPVFKDKPVAAIDDALVLKVLQPIWKDKTETASRLRGRIERVLDWARVMKYRTGDNPPRWKGQVAAMDFLEGQGCKMSRPSRGPVQTRCVISGGIRTHGTEGRILGSSVTICSEMTGFRR
jgi:hypothetical protein